METMSPTQEKAISAIEVHMGKFTSPPTNWYIGIANNVRQKLFIEHNVSEQNDKWIYTTLESNDSAKEIKRHFVNIGLQSEDSNDELGNIIFAYQKPIAEI